MKRLIKGQKVAMVNDIVDKFASEFAHMWNDNGVAFNDVIAHTIHNARELSNDLQDAPESLLLAIYDAYVCDDNQDCIESYFFEF